MKQFILFIFVLLPFCTFSQVQETFEGPEINDIWQGSKRDSFIITSDGRLQLNVNPVTSDKASIGMQISYASDMQWEFDVKMDNIPSDNNQLCVYLYLDTDNYYYVRFGYDGSSKLGFCAKDSKELLSRLPNNYAKGSWVDIKVTLEDNRLWTLYSKQHNASFYQIEGSCIQPVSPVDKGVFSFKFIYTKDRSKLFSIDNVKIQHTITPTNTTPPDDPDPVPGQLPELLTLEPITQNSLRFTFDSPVEIGEAVFTISGIGDAYRKSYVDEKTRMEVNTLFSGEMEIGKAYTVSYRGVKSVSGATLPAYSKAMRLEEAGGEEEEEPDIPQDPGLAASGGILINEIMADPKGLKELPETEYVELYNASGKPVSLSGWQFVYGGSAKAIGNQTLRAGQYAVLYRMGRDIEVAMTGLGLPMDNFPSALANTGKDLQLLDQSGKVIDNVTYAKATPAKSWERSASGWLLSADPKGGTPGAPNSSQSGSEPEEPETPEDPDQPDTPEPPVLPETEVVLPGDIILNELLPEPKSEGAEYIELYNRSNRSLPLSGLVLAIRRSNDSLDTRYPLNSLSQRIASEGYALLTKSKIGVESFYSIHAPSALYEVTKLPILANTSSTLVLFRTKDEVVIDEVSYSSKWHATSVKDRKGVSLERINPDCDTQDATNWTSASQTSGYGTPGYQNSQYGNTSGGGTTGIDSPVWTEESELYTISYLLDKSGYNCRAFVFNTSGMRVAEITNHELLGTSGSLTWNGFSQSGTRLQPGVYIFYAEAYHPDGTVKRFKRAFLIR